MTIAISDRPSCVFYNLNVSIHAICEKILANNDQHAALKVILSDYKKAINLLEPVFAYEEDRPQFQLTLDSEQVVNSKEFKEAEERLKSVEKFRDDFIRDHTNEITKLEQELKQSDAKMSRLEIARITSKLKLKKSEYGFISKSHDAEVNLAAERFNKVKTKTQAHIHQQHNVYYAAVPISIMILCLRVYAMFIHLYDAVTAQIPNNELVLEKLEFELNQQKFRLFESFNKLWCPESGNKTGINIFNVYRAHSEKEQKILFQSNLTLEEQQIFIPNIKGISLNDLNTRLVEIPFALREGNHESLYATN